MSQSSFWRALFQEPFTAVLASASLLTLIVSGVSLVSAPVRDQLMARHLGASPSSHLSLLAWPSMYSYAQYGEVIYRPGEAADPELCPGHLRFTKHHFVFRFEMDALRTMTFCDATAGTVSLTVFDGQNTRTREQPWVRTEQGWVAQ